ncbi:MAG: RsmD family RNA methyltransferase [Patescibacteria group bacterium]|jgi:16S rRNA (guanine(966)-N(2))-methyltransferase RsmD
MPQLRISSGSAKNKRLKAPKITGFRGVQEIVKSAAFSIIGQDNTDNAVCLDLYAGSGNMGLEALSRGAAWCDFVDNSALAQQAVEENLRNCGFTEKCSFILVDAVKFVAETPNKYNIIFADPFYADTTHRFLIKNIAEILNPKGWVVFTHGKELSMEAMVKDTNLVIYTQRRYGGSYLSILRKTGLSESA